MKIKRRYNIVVRLKNIKYKKEIPFYLSSNSITLSGFHTLFICFCIFPFSSPTIYLNVFFEQLYYLSTLKKKPRFYLT